MSPTTRCARCRSWNSGGQRRASWPRGSRRSMLRCAGSAWPTGTIRSWRTCAPTRLSCSRCAGSNSAAAGRRPRHGNSSTCVSERFSHYRRHLDEGAGSRADWSSMPCLASLLGGMCVCENAKISVTKIPAWIHCSRSLVAITCNAGCCSVRMRLASAAALSSSAYSHWAWRGVVVQFENPRHTLALCVRWHVVVEKFMVDSKFCTGCYTKT